MKPAPMSDEQIDALAPEYWDEWRVHAKAIIATRDAQWEQMLAAQPKQYVEGQYAKPSRVYDAIGNEPPLSTLGSRMCKSCGKRFQWTTTPKDTCQDCRTRVYDITGAEPPPPDSGFARLGEF